MPTSSKVMWKLETLREQALVSIDQRIANKHLEVAAHDDPTRHQQRINDWRTRQNNAVCNLYENVYEISDEELARFRIEPMPKADEYQRDKVVRELRQLEARRTQIEAKANSLVADEDGNIALTKTQLAEFFDL